MIFAYRREMKFLHNQEQLMNSLRTESYNPKLLQSLRGEGKSVLKMKDEGKEKGEEEEEKQGEGDRKNNNNLCKKSFISFIVTFFLS